MAKKKSELKRTGKADRGRFRRVHVQLTDRSLDCLDRLLTARPELETNSGAMRLALALADQVVGELDAGGKLWLVSEAGEEVELRLLIE